MFKADSLSSLFDTPIIKMMNFETDFKVKRSFSKKRGPG